MLKKLEASEFHPFVRCVGKAKYLNQELFHKAYDYRVLVFFDGNGTIESEDDVFETKRNDVYIISPGTGYRVVSKGRQEVVVINLDMTHSHSTICSPVVSVPDDIFVEDKIIETCDLSLFFGENKAVFCKKVPQDGLDICEKMLDVYTNRKDHFDSILLSALFSRLFCIMLNGTNDKRENTLAAEIFRYINENHFFDLNLENTADFFHIHPTYLNRLLNKNYNTSFRRLLLRVRFEKALQLLDNTDLTVKEISRRVGFNNPAYFSSAFYKHFGHYPTVYRK